MPLLALSQTLWQAAVLVVAERFGKAVRTPARDTMLAQASAAFGRGTVFAIREALDQSGALLGPLVVGGMIALSGYQAGFAVLAIPGALALLTLAWLHRAVPLPAAYEHMHRATQAEPSTKGYTWLPARFWLYTAFTAISMAGFTTFGVLAYHQEIYHILPAAVIPLTYAAAMGAGALAALASGRLYDRIGLRWIGHRPAAIGYRARAIVFDERHLRVGRRCCLGRSHGHSRIDNACRGCRPGPRRSTWDELWRFYRCLRVGVAGRLHPHRSAVQSLRGCGHPFHRCRPDGCFDCFRTAGNRRSQPESPE